MPFVFKGLISVGEWLMRNMKTGNVLKFVPHIGLARLHYNIMRRISLTRFRYKVKIILLC